MTSTYNNGGSGLRFKSSHRETKLSILDPIFNALIISYFVNWLHNWIMLQLCVTLLKDLRVLMTQGAFRSMYYEQD
jgi:hypothetical protein